VMMLDTVDHFTEVVADRAERLGTHGHNCGARSGGCRATRGWNRAAPGRRTPHSHTPATASRRTSGDIG
jgi:hypothetical protein